MTSKSILIVDDSEADHVLTTLVIETYDPSTMIYHAYDGQEALDLLASLEHEPQLIFFRY